MLLFSTLLEINDTMTKDSFIQLVLEWNQGSPHENIIQGIEWNGERNVRYGTEHCGLLSRNTEMRTLSRFAMKKPKQMVWLFDFYNAVIPNDVTSVADLAKWWKSEHDRQPNLLDFDPAKVERL